MTTLNKMLHRTTSLWCEQYRNNFFSSSHKVEVVQRKKLNNILKNASGFPAHVASDISPNMSWKDYADAVPISDYKSWENWIGVGRSSDIPVLGRSPIKRYQPTSGSTSAVKWIPYSQSFLNEINSALMTWIGDLYRRYPNIQEGYHYWSVSWVPTSLRDEVGENVNDDLKVLPWWKRWMASQYMAVPETVAQAGTSDDTLFASLAWLISRRDLTMLSIWSPTFALSLLEKIQENRDELVGVLEKGSWLDRSNTLRMTQCPQSSQGAALLKDMDNILDPESLARLWPKLSLISSWDTASSKVWADKLHRLFPNAAFQGKGLWATEGAVTIPVDGKYPLALNSHYYEFQDISSGEVLPSWKLEKGMEVSPLLTTGTGFLRYKLSDRLLVNDFLNECPCFEFKGRIDGADLAGEKISTETAQNIIDDFSKNHPVVPVSLLAIPGDCWGRAGSDKGTYVLLCEPILSKHCNDNGAHSALVHHLEGFLEESLLENFHYRLARELGQINHASVVVDSRSSDFYQFRCLQRGMAKGNIKIEPLVLWNTVLPGGLSEIFSKKNQLIRESHVNKIIVPEI